MNDYVDLLRPRQWIKNLAVLVSLPFGWLQYGAGCTGEILFAFIVFCLAGSGAYAFNDVLDRREDLQHPLKKNRPVARGAITPVRAVVVGLLLWATAIVLSLISPNPNVTYIVIAYIALILVYSLWLKHQPILDVILIAVGFVFRAAAGAMTIHVYISPWLIVCTFTLCLFLGFGKRRVEIHTIDNDAQAAQHRKTLARYSPQLLNQLLATSAGIALMTYLLYIMDAALQPGQPPLPFDKQKLLYTFPLVAYGLFRYAMLIETENFSGPTDIILKDKALSVTVLLWIAASACIVLHQPLFHLLGWS